MAIEFGDPTSGFRHTEVMQFINNEILMNGGDQDFYLIFRSRAWKDVEDALYNILGDEDIPRSHKRACTWSALALVPRVVGKQREQHMRNVKWLKEQLGTHQSLSWALDSELQQLCQQRDEAVTQLSITRSALHQVQSECDMLRGRLLQFERCVPVGPLTQDTVPNPQAGQLGATAWPLYSEQQRDVWAMGEQGRVFFETPVAAPASAAYMPISPISGSPSFWAPSMPLPLPVLMPSPFPLSAPFPMELPPLQLLTPAVIIEPEAIAPFQMPPAGIYPPGPLLALGNFQDEMAPLWDHSCYEQVEGPEMLQGSVPGDNGSLRQTDLQRPQGMSVLGERGYHRQEGDPERPLEMTPLGQRRNPNQKEGPLWLHGAPFLGENWQYNQEEGQGRPQWVDFLGDSRRPRQEDNQEGAQHIVFPGFSDIQSQAEVLDKAQDVTHAVIDGSHSKEGGTEYIQAKAQDVTHAVIDGSHSKEGGTEYIQAKAQDVTHAVIDGSHSKEEGTEYIQAMTAPGTSGSDTQGGVEKGQGVIPTQFSRMPEDEERPQCMISLGLKSHKQEESSERAQDATLWKSPSQALRESPKKQQPQQQKTEENQEKKTLESQEQKSVSRRSPMSWDCPWCKALNFSWHTTCSKCKKKICMPVESGDVDPEQTQ
ncbi:testis-expressed protein 13D isoform X2 [Fukomys damarensis]|uniref:Testis-expressed sequence 13B protein n=1 Tax=Fukomys damarensis TaxID=885580 RepID=A0A091CTX6_FUKDA|nr:testis-expressed protein 13D isoform X1 [Fukomys damarensis]XP_010608259.1 testis-expressed protein 13D isoform X2 [Fukomys damarensis]KFO21030.1 Testis-expressed sequence 13B protein [Fukomys damarensis]